MTRKIWEIMVKSHMGREIIRVGFSWKCLCCCCHILSPCSPSCGVEFTVESPPGTPIGKVIGTSCISGVEFSRCCHNSFEVFDENSRLLFKLTVPKKRENARGRDINFHLISEGKSVGRIGKHWDPNQV